MLGNRYIDDYLYYVNAEIYALMVAVSCAWGDVELLSSFSH